MIFPGYKLIFVWTCCTIAVSLHKNHQKSSFHAQTRNILGTNQPSTTHPRTLTFREEHIFCTKDLNLTFFFFPREAGHHRFESQHRQHSQHLAMLGPSHTQFVVGTPRWCAEVEITGITVEELRSGSIPWFMWFVLIKSDQNLHDVDIDDLLFWMIWSNETWRFWCL